jgi:ABC-type nickel/cobalt efflux system permease component RcnA
VEAKLTESTFEGVPGWHEIVVVDGTGATLTRSDVPDEDISDELTNYPPEMLTTPLMVRTANFAYTLETAIAPTASPRAAGASASPVPLASATPPPARPADPLVDLIGSDLSAASAALAVLVALGLGALHALSPGHGKTLVAAYLIGTRASVGQALVLGLTVAVTHTAGVFFLGIGTWFASEWFAADRVVSWLAVATGVLVVGLGALLLWRTRTISTEVHTHGPGGRAHRHPHTDKKRHAATEHVDPSPDLRRRDVAALGVVGGLVPSGSALILLLSSIALGKIPFGIVLIVMFGIGMAVVLVGLALGIVLFRRAPFLSGRNVGSPKVRRLAGLLPMVSGVAVVALGVVLTVEAVRNFR